EARRVNGVAPALLADELMLVRVAGQRSKAESLLREGLAQDPASPLFQWEAYRLGVAEEPAILAHLAADSQRLLSIARAYLRLGLYEEVVALLTQSFPEVDAAQMEPGEPTPAQNP